jgi:ribosomal protein S10
VHKRLLEIHNSNSKTIESLSKLDIPAGVSIEVKQQ